MEEDKISSSSLFITLTYDTDNVHITPRGFMNLDKRDVQLFMKKLRKQNTNTLKYYACGEYGDKTKRPHYHIILFNANLQTIQKNWKHGQIHYGTVSEASVGYTLKYMSKPIKVPLHQNDDRNKEFSLMSKGIGKSYLTHKMLKWHHADLKERMYCNIKDNKKIAMPRYYKEKIYNQEQRGELKSHHTEKLTKELEELAYNPNIREIMQSRKQSIKTEFRKLNHSQSKRQN